MKPTTACHQLKQWYIAWVVRETVVSLHSMRIQVHARSLDSVFEITAAAAAVFRHTTNNNREKKKKWNNKHSFSGFENFRFAFSTLRREGKKGFLSFPGAFNSLQFTNCMHYSSQLPNASKCVTRLNVAVLLLLLLLLYGLKSRL